MVKHFIAGYSDRFSVKAGETLSFMISTTAEEYIPSLLPLGFETGHRPDNFSEVSLPKRVPGRRQNTNSGSYAYVADFMDPHGSTSWHVSLWIYPTALTTGHEQFLVGTRFHETKNGWEITIDSRGQLNFRSYDSSASLIIELEQPLAANQWYHIVAGHDDEKSNISLLAHKKDSHHLLRASAPLRTTKPSYMSKNNKLFVGARPSSFNRSQKFLTSQHYNGRIDDLHICTKPPTEQTVCYADHLDNDQLLSHWDFSLGQSSRRVRDRGPARTDATLVNMPMRAVTGRRWNGEYFDFRQLPEHYSAVHFHDDDLADCDWDVDFTIEIPDHIRSGVYAVMCKASGIADYIPFVVTPAENQEKSPVVVVLPYFTYLAYGNIRIAVERDLARLTLGRVNSQRSRATPNVHNRIYLGKSLYDVHSDGTGFVYASWRRPLTNMHPQYRDYFTNSLRDFSLDLVLITWLNRIGVEFDVITDLELHRGRLGAIKDYHVVLTGSHPEYATSNTRKAFEDYMNQGGRLMYLGGNGFYWRTSLHPDQNDVIEVRRGTAGTRPWTSAPGELHHSTTGEECGLWRHAGKPPNNLVGIGFSAHGIDDNAGWYVRRPASYRPEYNWIFDGVGASREFGKYGLVMAGAAGEEVDSYNPSLGAQNAVVLATSTGLTDQYYLAIEEAEQIGPCVAAHTNNKARSDIVIWSDEHGEGQVFSVGSMTWIGSLAHNDFTNDVARITENILRHFMN